MKCRVIKIRNNKTSEWDTIPVSAVFNLAVMDSKVIPSYFSQGFWGINIGVSIPMKNEEEYISFSEKYFRWEEKFCTVEQIIFYLIGDNGENIPVKAKDANSYDEKFGGCCIFGFIVPDIVAEDDPPKLEDNKVKSEGVLN